MKPTRHTLPDQPRLDLADYLAGGGGLGLALARQVGADKTIDLIEAAGVRGRGGAGFPTGRKWRSLQSSIGLQGAGFVVINAAEGEPGTFKDRSLLRRNPYLVLEGALIAAHTLGVEQIVVATKARYETELRIVRAAIAELAVSELGQGVHFKVVDGPDHYLFGEETALLEVIEGEDPLPRHLPPYEYGLFTTSPQLGWSAGVGDPADRLKHESANPALVNNVETYAHVALVCRNGSDWYRSMGTDGSPGPTIVTITGDVDRAVVAEIELGVPLIDAIQQLAGGPRSGRQIKAVLSGVSNPVLSADRLSTPITYEHLGAAGGGLGSAGFIVFDETRNMIDVAYQVMRFLAVESCGQCNPCKTGTGDIVAELERLVLSSSPNHEFESVLSRRLATVTDASRCFLPAQAQALLASMFRLFPEDLEERRARPGDASLTLPKLVDIVDGVAVIDERQQQKRPDWTYAETPVRLAP